MAELKLPIPGDGPRVQPLGRNQVNDYVRAEYDKSIHTWGIPNNLIRTMACLPQLGLTEVDYANAFIFDENTYIPWPRPGGAGPKDTVLFPAAGFVDRVTKELVINLVSLLNRSRYSITHHSMIGFLTLSAAVPGADDDARKRRAETMLLNLVDSKGQPDYRNQQFEGGPLYDDYQQACLELAETLRVDAHAVTDNQLGALRTLMADQAQARISSGPLAAQFGSAGPDQAYVNAYVDGMVVELTWCIVHFAGLLNAWFTVLKVCDESDAQRDGIDFVSAYNATVPESIIVRNNNLLGSDGWGN